MVDRITVFLLHYLGGSARSWDAVGRRLGTAAVDCVGVDLPGFGSRRNHSGFSVEEMADAVAASIRTRAPARWAIAGHSMGAKVASVIARRAENGAPELAGLAGMVLVAGSPPSPEPMEEELRHEMLGWFVDDGIAARQQADIYLARNTGSVLADPLHGQAVDDALRMHPAAWRAWLSSGSREDWSDRVGRLRTPALVLAGDQDEQLGPEAQRALMMPHTEDARLLVVPGAGHLLPLERAADVARHMGEHLAALSR